MCDCMLWLAHCLTLGSRSETCCACAGSPGVHGLDPLRLTVAVGGWGVSGQAVAAALDSRFGVVPELATQQARAKGCNAWGTLLQLLWP